MICAHGQSIVVVVDEVSKVGEARRRSVELAAKLGFDETAQGKAALVATEAASNLVKHARGGLLILAGLAYGPTGACLDVLSLDSGPGMSELGQCMADGYSSAGSPGTGLGAISRLADHFEIYSCTESGTMVWARLAVKPQPRTSHDDAVELGVVRRAVAGEQVCGDDWAMIDRGGQTFILVVDGLGHGGPAARAAEESVRVFRDHRSQEPADIVESTHLAIRGTRGAALAIARVDLVRGELRYCGVGNISGVIVDRITGETTNMVSQNGTVGYAVRTIHSYDYKWTNNAVLVMHSDGLAGHWNLDRYPGLRQRHPILVAGALYRDHKRDRDDATVLVARFAQGEPP